MPRLRTDVKLNPIQVLFKAKKYELGITSYEMAERLGYTDSALRHKIQKGIWKSNELKHWCEVLGVSAEELGNALLQ